MGLPLAWRGLVDDWAVGELGVGHLSTSRFELDLSSRLAWRFLGGFWCFLSMLWWLISQQLAQLMEFMMAIGQSAHQNVDVERDFWGAIPTTRVVLYEVAFCGVSAISESVKDKRAASRAPARYLELAS